MKALPAEQVTGAPETGSPSMRTHVSRASLLDGARRIQQLCRQVFGIPDYERYLAHAAAHHPGARVLSRREFCAQAIERKYGKSGPRCC